jgi:PKD repeat protein
MLEKEPAGDAGSYRIMGIVKSGKTFVPGLIIHIWDVQNDHMVPVEKAEDGALSIPLYNSTFHILVEAEGYEPYWKANIDLNSGDNFFRPVNNTFSMTAVETKESKMTMIDLTGEDGIINPTITTIWTMDANSRIFGTPNPFGNPRMQASGLFPTADWLILEESEVEDAEMVLAEFGPAWIDTDYFFKVNNEAFVADLEAYDVELEDLLGGITEIGVNPVATMTTDYTTDLAYEEDDDLMIEISSLLDGETIEIILPDDYEILGDFDEDEAVHPDGNTSRLMVYVPLEFNAKKEERPVADLDFLSSTGSYRVEEGKYIVKLFQNVTLSAKASDDPVGEIVEYHWTNIPSSARIWLDDENLSISELTNDLDEIVIQFTQNSNQFINITLQVLDSSGRNSEKVDYVNIMPDSAKPTFINYTLSEEVETDDEEETEFELIAEPYQVDEDKLLEFNVTAEDNGEVVDYIWTFSDDSGSLNGEVVTKRFADPGVFNISLTLVDAVGNRNEIENKTITINDITEPMAVIKPFDEDDDGFKIGDDIEFNGTQSYDPRSGDDVTEGLIYVWYYYEEGDEPENQTHIGNGSVIEHSFSDPGVYRINLTVIDVDGNIGWTETNLVVNGADLVIENMEFIKPEVSKLEEGKTTKMSVLIRNIGKVDVNKSFDVVFYRDGEKKIKSHSIDGGLKAGESYYWNFSFTPDYSKEHEFKVLVDPDNVIKEDTDDNNEIIRPATIKTTESKLIDYWYVIPIIILILIAVYVVYMKYTRNMWGYEPIADWWNKRNA